MGQVSGRAINADLAQSDPDIAAFINQERQRQETHLELIASENFASRAVMQAQGSVLTNKYAEGLPSKRYYGGCEHVDAIEELAIERAKQLFGAASEGLAGRWRRGTSAQGDRGVDCLHAGFIPQAWVAEESPKSTGPATGLPRGW